MFAALKSSGSWNRDPLYMNASMRLGWTSSK